MSSKEEDINNIIDEAEETLSLSGLATSYNATKWADYYSRESQSSSSISSSMDQELQDEYFEFFSEEWSTTIPENIVFCGKLIPSKNPLTIHNETPLPNKRSSSSLFMSNSFSHKDRKGTIRNGTYLKQRSSSSKVWKWQSLLLVTARILTGGVELEDVKIRQSRQSPTSTPLIEINKVSHQEIEDVYRKRSRGLRGVIRALGCGDYFHTTNTKDSIKSLPRV
ncbi:hypothetical protein LIER_36964 [Lithospermum erythrorhizon]|uniref:Uncharacterized protein n=1 Tax=Lithospermum erythrorhizon TaxID=34254 RepID=A0AAV3PF89_LITER